jgi:DNA-binding MarR family transcriptional regulator
VSRLQDEIKQRKPFESLESEVFLNLVRTVDALEHGTTELLKQSALTAAQYNALRILRGAGPHGLMCGEISDRMLTRDPDVTRLLDRLERRALITRAREKSDRRVVTTRITDEGLTLLASLDEPVERIQREQLGHMTRQDLDTLRRLLEIARSPDAPAGEPPATPTSGDDAAGVRQAGAVGKPASKVRYSGLSEK